MKAWHVSELDNVIGTLQPLLGARLQEVQTTEDDLILGFYTNSGLLWIWIDLNAVRPSILPWVELPLRLKWNKTPLNLFLRAHFVGRVLCEAKLQRESGRVVKFKFGHPDEDGPELEIRLFPHVRNVIARDEGKQVAWQKPSPLDTTNPIADSAPLKVRSLDELRDQWLEARQGKAMGRARGSVDIRSKLEAELKRKEKALQKVDEELLRKKELPWRQVGDWLKQNQSLDVPKEWEPFIDKRRKLAWNIEECFAKARDMEGKLFGTEKRKELLLNDIMRVREQLAKPANQLSAEPIDGRAPKPQITAAEAHGRSLKVSDEVTVISGKSAADNMKLLRKARAWDLWIHLRDFPSSHAILFRNKNTKINDSVLNQVADWFVRHSLGKKLERHVGEKLQILIAECRHVRPIKGDKLGRVTYHDERVLIFKVPS